MCSPFAKSVGSFAYQCFEKSPILKLSNLNVCFVWYFVLTSSQEMSAYDNVIGGKLKLKGKALDVKAGGVKKKKKHKRQEEQALKITDHELIEGESTEALGKLIEGEEGDEEMNRSEKASEDAKLQQQLDDDDHLTPAERRYIEQKQRLDVQKLAKEANKSHRNRIEDFNQYLANMSEHYDIPKVGPG